MEMKNVGSCKTALTITLTAVKIHNNSHGNTPLLPEFTTVSPFVLFRSSLEQIIRNRHIEESISILKGLAGRFGDTAQLTYRALSGSSVRRKCHKSAISMVIIVMDRA